MNCASNKFISYRLLIMKLNTVHFHLTFEFFCHFFRDVAINVNGNLLFSNSL